MPGAGTEFLTRVPLHHGLPDINSEGDGLAYRKSPQILGADLSWPVTLHLAQQQRAPKTPDIIVLFPPCGCLAQDNLAFPLQTLEGNRKKYRLWHPIDP